MEVKDLPRVTGGQENAVEHISPREDGSSIPNHREITQILPGDLGFCRRSLPVRRFVPGNQPKVSREAKPQFLNANRNPSRLGPTNPFRSVDHPADLEVA